MVVAVNPARSAPPLDPDAVMRLTDVHKRFGDLIVLSGIDLTLRSGQTTVIIGESGSGKSVLLKHIVRLLKPDRGAVYFHEQRIDTMPEIELSAIRPRFGFLFQLGALFDSMSVGENIAFPVQEHTRRRPAEIEEIVARKLAMVGLDGIQNKWPAELSGGQRKRVALARAIALDPELILYDEPTTGLDPPRADVINELIIKLQRELNVTSVVVTHDMTSATKVADRILMLYQGRFIFDGTPDDVRRSDHALVRSFLEGRCTQEMLQSLQEKGEA